MLVVPVRPNTAMTFESASFAVLDMADGVLLPRRCVAVTPPFPQNEVAVWEECSSEVS